MKNYRLTIDSDGRLRGNAHITYNDRAPYGYQWPCVNGTPGGGSSSMLGTVMHTMVGNLPGTITVFNDPSYQASANIGIAQDGQVHQFGPLGFNWEPWAQMAGNAAWYSTEHADDGNPDNPLTHAQLFASAQVLEAESAFAGFPLAVTNSPDGKGFGTHVMGGAAWGGHTCPDKPPSHIRSQQRADILAIAWQIRHPVKPPKHYAVRPFTCDGTVSLNQVCAQFVNSAGAVLWRTFRRLTWQAGLVAYVSHANFNAPLPKGTVLMLRQTA